MKCPECGSKMNPRWLAGDNMQKCGECDGMWMDKGALDDFYFCHTSHDTISEFVWPAGTGAFKKIVPKLIDLLMSDNRQDRYRAARIIAEIGPDAAAAVPVLTDILLSDSWLQESAAKALNAIGPAADTAIDALGTVLNQHQGAHSYAFLSAAHALGRIGSARAVPYLMEAVRDPCEQGPGWVAIHALARLGPLARDAVPVLAEILKDPRFDRDLILYALGRIGPADGEACAAIVRTFKRTRSKSLRENAMYALRKILFSDGEPPHELAAIFRSFLKDRDKDIRKCASDALERLRSRGYD